MKGNLYILSGASGSGKTTLLNIIVSKELVVKAPKYSERTVRKLIDGIDDPEDDIIHIDDITSSNCDIKYVINGKYYGIKTKEIIEILNSNRDCAVIISDLRIVQELKEKINESAISIYISSNISPDELNSIHNERHPFHPSKAQIKKLELQFSRLTSATNLQVWEKVVECMRELLDEWDDYLPESKSIKIRTDKIRLFHNRYIDNIEKFDHVILNYDSKKNLFQQFSNIKSFSRIGDIEQSNVKFPPIFFLSAASGAGKATLMSHINLIGSSKLKLVTKFALRDKKNTDKRDGMIALGSDAIMPEDVDWTWAFHKSSSFRGIEYGVRKSEIERNLKDGIPQIVVSNIGQIDNAISLFGEHIVPIYLHSTRSKEEIRRYQFNACGVYSSISSRDVEMATLEAESRIEEIEKVYQSFIENISKICHVILNTTYQEDMYDQIFSLLDAYTRK